MKKRWEDLVQWSFKMAKCVREENKCLEVVIVDARALTNHWNSKRWVHNGNYSEFQSALSGIQHKQKMCDTRRMLEEEEESEIHIVACE